MAFTLPTVADFKAQFVRDFPYAPAGDATNADYVMDADIALALTQANLSFNDNLFGDVASSVFLYLAAFYLVENLKNAAKGIAAQATFILNSNSVGSVSQSFTIPDRFTKDPILAQYTRNAYGMQYLTLALPYLVGNVQVIAGTTTWA